MNGRLAVLVLAAGGGTRMKSASPKVLHPVCEVPMLFRVLRSISGLKPQAVGVVVGHQGEAIRREVNDWRRGRGLPADLSGEKKIEFIWQKELKGSGHAVQMSSQWIKKVSAKGRFNTLLLLCGDVPLISIRTLRVLAVRHFEKKNSATLCSMKVSEPFGYGRVVRGPAGEIRKIAEEKDASEREKEIDEVNSGIYCFDSEKLLEALPHLENKNAKGEYYLTDVISFFHQKGYPMDAVSIFLGSGGRDCETLGINTREDLAVAEEQIQRAVLKKWMEKGVTVLSPSSTYIGEKVRIGKDTVLLPGSMLLGETRIGSGCAIGPNSLIKDSRVGDETVVRASFVYGSKIGDRAQIGPFSHLRPGTAVADGARIGNFTEIKNSKIGRNTKVSHLSYIGDTMMGEEINVGAGAITCNFDGKFKHKTVIGSGSFIGSNVNLVAPVRVGAKALIGAGSTITQDVPSGSLALERGRQVIKKNWVKKKIKARTNNEN